MRMLVDYKGELDCVCRQLFPNEPITIMIDPMYWCYRVNIGNVALMIGEATLEDGGHNSVKFWMTEYWAAKMVRDVNRSVEA